MEERKGENRSISIEHMTNPEVKEELRELIISYQPIVSKSTGVKMHVVLANNISVQSPRRLSAEQKDIFNEIIRLDKRRYRKTKHIRLC